MRIYHFDSTTNLVGGVGEPVGFGGKGNG